MSKKKRYRSTLAVKLFAMLFVFAVVPGGGLAWWTIEHMRDSRRDATLEAMEAVAAGKAEAIDRFMSYRRGNVERIAGLVAAQVDELHEALVAASESPGAETPPDVETLPALQDAEQLPPTGTPPETPSPSTPRAQVTPPVDRESAVDAAEAQLRRTLGLVLWDRSEFEELLVIDPGGRVLVSTFEGHEARDASSVAYFQQGLAGTYVQPVFLSPITERYTVVVSTPVYSEDRVVLAVLAARLNLERFFALITETKGLGETGETVAAKSSDGEIVLQAPTRHDPDSGPGTVLANAQDLPIAIAARGEGGRGEAVDLRGVPVLASWRHLEALNWGLVVKIDEEEAMRPVDELQRALWFAFLVMVLIAGVIAVLAAGTIVRPLRQLRSAADKVSRGDMAVTLDIRSKDEVGELAESFERMVAAIRFFREMGERAERTDETLQREIEEEAAAQAREEAGD